MKKRRLKDDLEMMDAYCEALEQELEELHRVIGISNGTVAKQIDHIDTLNRQLEQQDVYMNRYMEELAVLKRMYRDDLINNFKW